MNQRGRTPPRDSGKRPPPPSPPWPCGTKGLRAASPGAGLGFYTHADWPAGPLGSSPGQRDPPPPRPVWARSRGMGTRRPRPRAHTDPGSGRTHAAHGAEAQHPGFSRTLDSGSGFGRREEGVLRCPPGGAAGAGAALTRLCRRSVSSARCAPAPAAAARAASAALGRAGGRTLGLGTAVPRARSALPPRAPPRPGHARWQTPVLEPGGAVPAGKPGSGREGGRERGTPLTMASGLLGSPPYRLGFHFTDQETQWWRGCPLAARLWRAGRAVSDLTQSSPKTPSPRCTEREIGVQSGEAPPWMGTQVGEISKLSELGNFPPPPCPHFRPFPPRPLPFVSPLPTPARVERTPVVVGVERKRLGFPRHPPP